MKKENSLCPAIKELERIYEVLCEEFKFVNKSLSVKKAKPIITIQSKGQKKNTAGWHWPNKWQNGKKDVSEINICAEGLKDDPVETLIHEMVHHHNNLAGIKDCNSQQYHNKAFKSLAETYGLNVEKDGRRGWSCTSLSESLKDKLKKLKIDYDVFSIYRLTPLSTKAPTKMAKYTCSCTTVRCATPLNALCRSCNEQFARDDG